MKRSPRVHKTNQEDKRPLFDADTLPTRLRVRELIAGMGVNARRAAAAQEGSRRDGLAALPGEERSRVCDATRLPLRAVRFGEESGGRRSCPLPSCAALRESGSDVYRVLTPRRLGREPLARRRHRPSAGPRRDQRARAPPPPDSPIFSPHADLDPASRARFASSGRSSGGSCIHAASRSRAAAEVLAKIKRARALDNFAARASAFAALARLHSLRPGRCAEGASAAFFSSLEYLNLRKRRFTLRSGARSPGAIRARRIYSWRRKIHRERRSQPALARGAISGGDARLRATRAGGDGLGASLLRRERLPQGRASPPSGHPSAVALHGDLWAAMRLCAGLRRSSTGRVLGRREADLAMTELFAIPAGLLLRLFGDRAP